MRRFLLLLMAASTAQPQSKPALLTELQGKLASQREYDLWLIANVDRILKAESRQQKFLSYCMATVHQIEVGLAAPPEAEYALRPDGTVAVYVRPRTAEQRFGDGERARMDLLTGGSPEVRDCAGALFWFGTWHDKPMPTDDELKASAAKAKADLEQIEKRLDPILVEYLKQ